MRENRKKTIRIAVLILILLLGIGYAALRTTLKIDGTVNVDKATWDVHFENVNITPGSVTANPAPTSDNTTTTEMTYTINFTKPGDFFEFTTDIVNDGTIDAMVDVVDNKTYNSNGTTEIQIPSYLTNTVTYDGGKQIKQNQELKHGTSKKIRVRIEFKKDITTSDLPSDGDTSVVFKFGGTFKQANANVIKDPESFATDSWETIADNTTSNLYQVGDTKTIQMDIDEDGEKETYTLRIANKSTPSECNNEGFSQTACGFVLEFENVLLIHVMNSEATNMGGYPASDLYKKFFASNATKPLYDKLPNDLRSKVIDTKVISSHEKNVLANYITIDKLYLLSQKEIGIDGTYDSAKDVTRKLDYYLDGLTYQAKGKRVKSLSDIKKWWLRTSHSEAVNCFYGCINEDCSSNHRSNGYLNYENDVENTLGVSPAFRIG